MAYREENNADRAIAPSLTAAGEAGASSGGATRARTPERNGRANGLKERNLTTRLRQIGVSVPRVRGGEGAFRPASLEAALLSEKALKVALAEMYLQEVTTRRVKEILEALCGFEVSSAEVSRSA